VDVDVAVGVNGDPKRMWDALLLTLANNRYRVEKQTPPTSVLAKRGNKATSLVWESKTTGFRELQVLFVPQGGDAYQVQFTFKFPVWVIPTPQAKKELSGVADAFLAQLGMAAQSASAEGKGVTCPKCKASNRPGAAFCEKCGTKLEPPGPRTCPKCKAPLSTDAQFCSKCGTKVG